MNAYSDLQTSANNSWAPSVAAITETAFFPPLFDNSETEQKARFKLRTKDLTIFDEVRRHFILPRDNSVVSFLEQHRILIEVLVEAIPRLRICFGATAIFNLEAPIDESGTRTLYAVATWAGELQDVRSALDKFDKDWWMANAHRAAGYLTFTYKLV